MKISTTLMIDGTPVIGLPGDLPVGAKTALPGGAWTVNDPNGDFLICPEKDGGVRVVELVLSCSLGGHSVYEVARVGYAPPKHWPRTSAQCERVLEGGEL